MADPTGEPDFSNPLSGGAIAGIIIGTIVVCMAFLLLLAYKSYKDLQLEEAVERLALKERSKPIQRDPQGAASKPTATNSVTEKSTHPRPESSAKASRATTQSRSTPSISYIKQAAESKPKQTVSVARPAVLDVSTIDVGSEASFENPLFGKFNVSPTTLMSQNSTELFVDPDDGVTKINIGGTIEEVDFVDEAGIELAPPGGLDRHVTFNPILDLSILDESEDPSNSKKKIRPSASDFHSFSYDSEDSDGENDDGDAKKSATINGDLLTLGTDNLLMMAHGLDS